MLFLLGGGAELPMGEAYGYMARSNALYKYARVCVISKNPVYVSARLSIEGTYIKEAVAWTQYVKPILTIA